jgi:hypothetical protein
MKWKDIYKIGVTGSRKFGNPSNAVQYIEQYIKKNFESTEDVVIITGGAIGVDAAIELMCMRRGIKNLIVYARWLELELVAGPRRNQHIVDMSNEVLAFWDGQSRGTKDCIQRVKKSGKEYKVFSNSDLIKLLRIKPPVSIVVPRHVTNTTAHKIRDLVDQADLTGFFNEVKLKKTKKRSQ